MDEPNAESIRRNAAAAVENSDGGTTVAHLRKRARRVSFAEMTSVHFFDRDDEYNETPKVQTAKFGDDSANEQPEHGEDNDRNEDEDEEGDEMDMPRSFLRPIGSPSPGGSTFGSASSNDEDNFFGPVSANFIRPGRLSDSAASDDNHDVTMDSTAFSMHYRSLARSESGVDLKTPTTGQLFFEDKTPTDTSRGSPMIFTLGKRPIPKSAVPVTRLSGSDDSNDMSLVGHNPNKYDYEKLSPGLDLLLAETRKNLLSVNVSDDIIVSESPKRMEGEVLPSVNHGDKFAYGVFSPACSNFGEANSAPGTFRNGHSPQKFSSSSKADYRPIRSPHQLSNDESEAPFMAAVPDLVKERQIFPVIASPSKHLAATPLLEQPSSFMENEYMEHHESEKSIQRSISKLEFLEKSALSSAFSNKVDNSTIKFLDFLRSPNFDTFSERTRHVFKIDLLEDSAIEERLRRVNQSKEKRPAFSMGGSGTEALGNLLSGELPNDSISRKISAVPENWGAAASSPKVTWSQNNRKRSLFTSKHSSEDVLTTETDSLLSEIVSGQGGNEIVTTPKFVSSPGRRLDKKILASPALQSSQYEDLSLHNQYKQSSNINKDQDSTPERDPVDVELSAVEANVDAVSLGITGELSSPTVEINRFKNSIEVKATDITEANNYDEKEIVGTMDSNITPDKDKRLLVMHSNILDVSNQVSRLISRSEENLSPGDPRDVSPSVCGNLDEPRSLKNLAELPMASPSREVFQTKQSSTPSPKPTQFNGRLENISAKKRNAELLLVDQQHRTETTAMHRSPKIQKGGICDPEKLLHSNGGSDGVAVYSHEGKQWTDVLMIQRYSKFSEDMKQLISRSAGELNDKMIDVLDDMLAHKQRSHIYELLRSGLQSTTVLHELQFERIAETSPLLDQIVFGKAKLQLKHVKRERLLKRLQLLSSRIQKSQILQTNISSLQLQTCTTNDIVDAVGNESADLNLNKKQEVSHEKLTSMWQILEALERKILNVKQTLHACCKIRAEPSHDDTIALVNEQLMKRVHCRLVRLDMQMWVVHSVGSVNGQHNVVLNYLDFIFQSIKVLLGPTSSSETSYKLNETNVIKNYPNMDACTAFALVFRAETIHKYVGAKTLAQETQVTSSLLGTLLDVLEEVQLAQMEFKNLTLSNFCSSSVEQLDLILCFFNFNTGRKVILTLDLSCLKRGIYPSEVLPLQLSPSIDRQTYSISEPILGDLIDAVKSVRTGYTRIFRLCRCISQVVHAAST